MCWPWVMAGCVLLGVTYFLGSDLTFIRCPSAHLWGLLITHRGARLRCGAASSGSFLLPYREKAGAKRASLGHRGHLSCFPGRMAAPSGIRGSFNEPPRRLCALRRSGVCRPSACFTAFSCPCTRLISAKHHAPHMRQWLHQRGQARAQCRSSGGAGAGRDGWDGRAEPGIAGAAVSGDGAMRRVPLIHCNTERPCMADLRAY